MDVDKHGAPLACQTHMGWGLLTPAWEGMDACMNESGHSHIARRFEEMEFGPNTIFAGGWQSWAALYRHASYGYGWLSTILSRHMFALIYGRQQF